MLKNAIWLFIIAVVVLVLFLPSYSRMQDLKQKNDDYLKQINTLAQQNTKLREEKYRLENDPEYLEKIARERMGLIKNGEIIYKMEPEEEK